EVDGEPETVVQGQGTGVGLSDGSRGGRVSVKELEFQGLGNVSVREGQPITDECFCCSAIDEGQEDLRGVA
ncbi:hypothetical protein C0992_009572, partial [Termitomyces sp. T32_za158]